MRDLRRMPSWGTAWWYADLSGLVCINSQKNKRNDFSLWNLNLKRIRFQVCFRFSMCRFYRGTDFRRPRQWNPWTVFATFPKLTAIISIACIFCKPFLTNCGLHAHLHAYIKYMHAYIHTRTYVPIWLMPDLRRMPRRWTAWCHADLSGLTYTNSQKIKKMISQFET